ncbi:MAG: tetratricopeptide repeat protein [Planctomycetes bacterium]|nr:tetratricopeptide repeat protein [Planctomycetota bacterium]
MTTMTHNPAAKLPAIQPPRSGFQPIPTRIHDTRGGQISPLGVQPAAAEDKAMVEQSLAELGTKLAEIHRIAAEAYLSQGSYSQALPHLDAAATLAPTDAEFRLQLGFVRYVTGDDAGAIDAYNAVITQEPNNSEAWYSLGMVQFGQGEFAGAEQCFGRAAEIHPDDAQAWNNRGVCLWQMSRLTEARTCFEQALRSDANDADAKFNLAQVNC